MYKFALKSGQVECYVKVERSGACTRFGVVDHDLNKTRNFSSLLGDGNGGTSDVWWDYGGTCHYFKEGDSSKKLLDDSKKLIERNVKADDCWGWRLDVDKQVVEYNVNNTGWKQAFKLNVKKNWTIGLSISGDKGGTSLLFSRNSLYVPPEVKKILKDPFINCEFFYNQWS